MSANIAEVAIPYAILALHDDGVAISAENINKMLAAAGIELEPVWVNVFVQAFAGQDVGKFLTAFTSSAPAGAAAPAAAAAAAPAAAAEDKKAAKKVESEDDDVGLGLFD